MARYFDDRCTNHSCFNKRKYFPSLLDIIYNSFSECVNWSFDGKYLKLNYRQFSMEYLNASPVKWDNVFTFINQMQYCGFRCLCKPYDVDADELVFMRLDDHVFHQCGKTDVGYEGMYYNATLLQGKVEYHLPRNYLYQEEDAFNESESPPMPLHTNFPNHYDPGRSDIFREIETTPKAKKISLPRRKLYKRRSDLPRVKKKKKKQEPTPVPCRPKYSLLQQLSASDLKCQEEPSSTWNPTSWTDTVHYEEDDNDVFIKESSRDVMLSDACEINDDSSEGDNGQMTCGICQESIIRYINKMLEEV